MTFGDLHSLVSLANFLKVDVDELKQILYKNGPDSYC